MLNKIRYVKEETELAELDDIYYYNKSYDVLYKKIEDNELEVENFRDRYYLELSGEVGDYSVSGLECEETKTQLKHMRIDGVQNLSPFQNYTVLEKLIINGVETLLPGLFENCGQLKSVVAEDVKNVEANAFKNCVELSNIVLSSDLISLGDSVFDGCTSLSAMTLPDSIDVIGNNTFQNCSALTLSMSAIVRDKFGVEKFNGVRIKIKTPPGLHSGDTELTSVSLNGFTALGDNDFYGCTGLTEIEIPDSVMTIGENVFYGCTNLTIKMTDTVYNRFPEKSVFCGRPIVLTIENDPSPNEYENDLLLKEIILQHSIIPQYCFYGCTGLTQVNISETIHTIEENAFDGCTGLTEIELPNTVTTMEANIFENTNLSIKLTDTMYNRLPESIFCGRPLNLYVGSAGVFSGHLLLRSVVILSSVTNISANAFSGCTNLISLVIEGSPVIGQNAFLNCPNLTIDVFDDTYYTYGYILNAAKIHLLVKSATINDREYASNSNIRKITFTSTVQEVKWEAFYECENLTTVVTQNPNMIFGNNVFSYCSSLTDIELPENMTQIPGNFFNGCTSLVSVTFPSTVVTIGDSAFEGCTKLYMRLPDTIESFGPYPFYYCTKAAVIICSQTFYNKFSSYLSYVTVIIE